MKNRKWKRILATCLISIVLLLIVFVLPYFLKSVNSFLNSKFGNISLTAYITCFATLFTGILAVAISVFALQISRKADNRDQQQNKYMLNTAKKYVREYLKYNGMKISEIERTVADRNILKDSEGLEKNLSRLLAYSVITKEQGKLCRNMSREMQEIRNAKSPEEAIKLSGQFLKEHTDQNTAYYQENESYLELLQILQEEE